MRPEKRRYHILVTMRNKPGGAARIAGLFTRRGYNIENITAGSSRDKKYSRLTITIIAREKELDQIVKQVYKQIDVVRAKIGYDEDTLKRELLLIKVNCDVVNRSTIIELADVFDAKILNVTPKTMVVELIGKEDTLDNFVELIESYGILEIARTGICAMSKGDKF